ncbi:hypothetical protein [Achromobacter sp. RTa]|uniref:hypothetical protein n=1 Tax=Achromobacter sp. RTa TaxID=1532557 RepID=UPI00068C6EF9|nr:hypothetical protein [Achromobacter sp. RTa]
MIQASKLQKSAALLVIPVLLTIWFVSDGGLRNGLNRLAYEMTMGLFFTSYGLLWGLAEIINRLRKQSCPFNLRLMGWSFSLLLAWVVLASLYERFHYELF